VTTALRKVKDLPYSVVANGHGPLLRFNVPEMVGRYEAWSKAVAKASASVLVLYAADYGYSDRLSQVRRRLDGQGAPLGDWQPNPACWLLLGGSSAPPRCLA
jgi:hypothetical protein